MQTGRAPVTARHVAERAGVALSTVSNVLNRPEIVSPDTLARVRAAIDELGYVRNDAARSLRLGRSRAVGLVLSEATSPFFDELARAAGSALSEHGFVPLVGNSVQDPDAEAELIRLFEAQRVQGILVSPVGPLPPTLDDLARRGVAVVSVDVPVESARFCSVAVDDEKGARLVVDHLVAAGRRRIALVRGPADLPQVAARVRGARAAASRAGAALEEIVAGSYFGEAGVAAGGRILEMGAERPDAVFAVNDPLAMGVLAALVDGGVRVPDDIAVVGYDDVPLASLGRLPLTSVRQPVATMGATAADMLVAELRGERHHRHRAVTLDPELIVRASSVAD